MNLKGQLKELEKSNRDSLDSMNILKDSFYNENTDNELLTIINKIPEPRFAIRTKFFSVHNITNP